MANYKIDFIEHDENDKLTEYFTKFYNIFNHKKFDDTITCPAGFSKFFSLIYDSFGQSADIYEYRLTFTTKLLDLHPNTVVLGFSGGLDSVYQAVELRKHGYDVILFHVRNINFYENGQSYKAAVDCANKLGMPLVVKNFHSTMDKENKKQWPENPMKNQYIICAMIDYCMKNGYNTISLGDPRNLEIKYATPGINLTDAIEIDNAFMFGIYKYIKGLKEIDMWGDGNKYEEMLVVNEAGLEDCYYSCITAGRMNKSLHNKDVEKYHIHLPLHNCGCHCRKCATQNLLMHYDGGVEYPQEFIDKCWRKLWDNQYPSESFQFNPDIPLEQRIKNLHTT